MLRMEDAARIQWTWEALEDWPNVSLTITSHDGQQWSSTSFNAWTAFIVIYGELYALGWQPLCGGARANLVQSGMMADTTNGFGLYIATLREGGKILGKTSVFAPALATEVGTPQEQEDFARGWREVMDARPRWE